MTGNNHDTKTQEPLGKFDYRPILKKQKRSADIVYVLLIFLLIIIIAFTAGFLFILL
jgi:hypothetical protein